jgi:hypothetical protein
LDVGLLPSPAAWAAVLLRVPSPRSHAGSSKSTVKEHSTQRVMAWRLTTPEYCRSRTQTESICPQALAILADLYP